MTGKRLEDEESLESVLKKIVTWAITAVIALVMIGFALMKLGVSE